MMSPTTASVTTISPPAPRPWSARNPISSPMLCESPQSAEPTRKITIAAWSTILRPNRSPSLPYSGPETVAVRRYAVTTQDRWSRPPRSPTIVGSAVETIVWSSAASRSTSSSAPKMSRTRWRDSVTASDPPAFVVLELSRHRVAVEEAAEAALVDRRHQAEVVLEHPRAAEPAGRDRVEARVADQELRDADRAVLGRVQAAGRDALRVDLAEERRVIAVERFCYRTAHVRLDLVRE